jgi:hypothetical protein
VSNRNKLRDVIEWLKLFPQDHEVGLCTQDGKEWLIGNPVEDPDRRILWLELYEDEKSPTNGMLMGFDGVLHRAP